VLAGTLSVPGPAQEKTPAMADERVIELPPFLVEDSAAPLRWRYAAVDGMELLSLCDDSASVNFAQRAHRLKELLHVLAPERYCFRSDVPEINLLVNDDVNRFHSHEIIDELVRKEGATIGSDGVVRLFQAPVPDLSLPQYIPRNRVSFLPNLHLWDADQSANLIMFHSQSAQRFTLLPDRVVYELERRVPALPEWFKIGTSELFRRASIEDDYIAIGPAVWRSEAESIALARDPLHPRGLLPMRQLFTPQRPKDEANGRRFDSVWRAQCALFVRWALLDHEGAYRPALWRLVDRLEHESFNAELFQQVFGFGLSDAYDRLNDYLPSAVKQRVVVAGPESAPLPRIEFRDAEPGEVARIRGDWERLEIAYVREQLPSLVPTYVTQARRTLHRAFDRGVRDPRLLAVLGLTECDAGNAPDAEPFLEQAVREHVIRPRAYVELARLRYEAAFGAAAKDLRVPAEQIRDIIMPVLQSLHAAPPLVETYGLLAEAWSHAATSPPPDQLAILNAGAHLFPQFASYVARVIEFDVAAGNVRDAVEIADAGLRATHDPAIHDRLDRIRAKLVVAPTP
jgi:hypothetical protein